MCSGDASAALLVMLRRLKMHSMRTAWWQRVTPFASRDRTRTAQNDANARRG